MRPARCLFPLFFTAALACSAARFAWQMAGQFRAKFDPAPLPEVMETSGEATSPSTPAVPAAPPSQRPRCLDIALDLHKRGTETVALCVEQALPWRDRLIALDSWLFEMAADGVRSTAVVSGKDGWLFLHAIEHGHCIEDYRGVERFDEETTGQIRTALEDLHRTLAADGVQFCFLVAPNKENVYPEFMPPDILRLSPLSRVDVLADALAEAGKVPVFNAKPALLEAKPVCGLYYPTDTHWNQAGAYVGAQGVLETLGRPSVPLASRTVERRPDPVTRDLARMIGKTNADFPNASYWCLPDLQPIPEDWAANDDWKQSVRANPDARSGDTLLLVGDSFMTGMVPAFLEEFREVRTVHMDLCDDLSALVGEFRPDACVFEIVERSADELLRVLPTLADSFAPRPPDGED